MAALINFFGCAKLHLMRKINKLPIFEWFYEQGDVFLTISTKGSDMLYIPAHFYEKESEMFVVGESSTPNLTYNEEGINTPMRFGGNVVNCFFPWESITMIAGNCAVIQFAVNENQKEEQSQAVLSEKKKPSQKKMKGLSHLKVIK